MWSSMQIPSLSPLSSSWAANAPPAPAGAYAETFLTAGSQVFSAAFSPRIGWDMAVF